jgi:hypothetical protein
MERPGEESTRGRRSSFKNNLSKCAREKPFFLFVEKINEFIVLPHFKGTFFHEEECTFCGEREDTGNRDRIAEESQRTKRKCSRKEIGIFFVGRREKLSRGFLCHFGSMYNESKSALKEDMRSMWRKDKKFFLR